MAERCLQVFARAPVAGEVKSRLIPALGADGAAALHARLLERTLATAAALDGVRLELWCAPDQGHPAFAAAAERLPLTLHTQGQGGLGARMHAALADGLDRHDRVVLVGCDCPARTADDLEAAFASLAGHDVVLGPVEDGGYTLVGARRVTPVLFDGVDWGGDRVLRQTRARLVALGWRWHELPVSWDVDRPGDLARLAEVGLG
jgi:rSAM/selenodomain-associated transferase 1